MKTIFIAIGVFVLSVSCYAQTLNLSISNPQPRLGQTFTISVNVDTINKAVFRFSTDNFKILAAKNPFKEGDLLSVDAEAIKPGKNEIGPLNLEFNEIKYTTNKIEFEIIDSLPAVDKGLWIRKVRVNDSVYLVLIDQRIPSKNQNYYSYSSNSTTIETKSYDGREGQETEINTNEITNVNFTGSEGKEDYKTIRMPAATLRFKYSFWVYRLTILDKQKPIILHKNNFTNLPDYYKFEDIVIN